VVTTSQSEIKNTPQSGRVSGFKAPTVLKDAFPDVDFTHGQSVI